MSILLKNIGQLVTCKGDNSKPKQGKAQSDIGLVNNGFLYINKDKIEFAGGEKEFKEYSKSVNFENEIDCTGKVVMPGIIDSHTHFVFAGSRADEYEMRIKGSTYEEIAAAGGGISSTVNAVRNASADELTREANRRLNNFFRTGTLTIEGKSGYGLDTENEMKILDVMCKLNESNEHSIDILPTFLGAHSVPKGMPKSDYIDIICNEMIPSIKSFGGKVKFIDVFCEENYFTPEETSRILTEGEKINLVPRIHTDQFHSIGGVDTAIKHNAASIDHLEVFNDNSIKKLKDSGKNIIATVLPGVSYFLDIPYAPARKLIDSGIPLAIATDFNPGSCMTQNMRVIFSLASINMKLSAEEIINAVTFNAAYSLRIQDRRGSLEKGKQADVLVYDYKNYKDLFYNFGMNDLTHIIKKGKLTPFN
jgi:imidazolonepropionase